MSAQNTPWSVYHQKLRPNIGGMITQIHGADGKVVMPWTGFDATGLSPAKQKALAAFIVKAVNAFAK